jgi:hypothetical protein
VYVDFNVFAVTSEGMNREKLEAVVADLIQGLKGRDSRFNAAEHLSVVFRRFPDELVAGWQGGTLTMGGEVPRRPRNPD